MTAAGTRPGFDADTALEQLGDGHWRARVDPSWFVTDAPNGGFMAALATRALEAVSARPARSLTLHFLEPPEEGPVEVFCTLERAGRTSTFTSLRFVQRDRTVVLGLGVAAAWREDQPEWDDVPMPGVPDLDDAPPFGPGQRGLPPYFDKYAMRWALGDFSRPEGPARLGAWMSAAGERPLDAPLLAAMTDALMPPAFLRTGFRALVPTIDLTIHFRAPAPAGERWVLGVFESRVAAGGAVEEDGTLFAPDGRVLVQSRQLAIIRRGG